MKNRQIEKLKEQAKLWHRHRNREVYQDGVIVRHKYGEIDTTKLTWWDDTGFILNNYRVLVSWTHPRNAYNDAVENLAHEKTDQLFKKNSLSIKEAKPIYKKIGKSRKKVRMWSGGNFADANREWYDAFKEEHARLLVANDIVIRPKMEVEWKKSCRFVAICVPMEVRSVEDLKVLCALVKRLLKRETTIAEEFLNYTYTVEDWKAETGASFVPGLNSHQVL